MNSCCCIMVQGRRGPMRCAGKPVLDVFVYYVWVGTVHTLPVHALDLGYKAPGLLPCCWASVLSADQWRLAAGRRAAIHLSGVQLCNLRGEKRETGAKTKYIRKRGDVSRQILQVLFFIFVHIVGISFLLPQPEKPEGFKATKRFNQRRIAASVNRFIGHRKWLDIRFGLQAWNVQKEMSWILF